MNNKTVKRGPMGHGGHMGGEKAENFGKAMKQLVAYMSRLYLRLAVRFLTLSDRKFWVMRQQKYLTD